MLPWVMLPEVELFECQELIYLNYWILYVMIYIMIEESVASSSFLVDTSPSLQ